MPVARELGHHKIRAVNISPGSFITPIYNDFPQAARDYVAGLTLRGSSGKAEYFAHFVQSIIENSYINGSTLSIDDGLVVPQVSFNI